MTMYREVLRLHYEGGLSQRDIAMSCQCAHSTVKRILARAEGLGLDYAKTKELSESTLAKLLYPKAILPKIQKMPDYSSVSQEITKSGVTLMLLWNEYCEKCRETGDIPYMYSQFSRNYREYMDANNASMHIAHRPAEIMEVDWAGTKIPFHDELSGKDVRVSLFVSCLPYSGYCYAEAFMDEKLDSWLTAHVHAYNFYGGAARILRPDNLKTGVVKPDKYDPELNPSYRELAEYYGSFVSPARIRKPKDKATVEGTVGMLTTHIIAALRNTEFHTLKELNNSIRMRLNAFNSMPFQKKDGSRESIFLTEEKAHLHELPKYEYQIAHYKDVKVPNNYHIQADDKKYYSVPFTCIGKKVTVRTTMSLVEVYSGGERIACHAKGKGDGMYITESAHMPDAHRHMYDWDNDKFVEWGAGIGADTLAVIRKILKKSGGSLPGYKFCMGLLSLEKKYSKDEIEEACSTVLRLSSSPSLKSIKLALSVSNAKNLNASSDAANHRPTVTGFRRGNSYYGGNDND